MANEMGIAAFALREVKVAASGQLRDRVHALLEEVETVQGPLMHGDRVDMGKVVAAVKGLEWLCRAAK